MCGANLNDRFPPIADIRLAGQTFGWQDRICDSGARLVGEVLATLASEQRPFSVRPQLYDRVLAGVSALSLPYC